MTFDTRCVLDSSAIVSAVLLPRSVPRQAIDRACQRGKLLLSNAILDELEEVLRRPRFDRYITEDQRLDFLAALVYTAELVQVTVTINECRDPKDNKFLELAVSGQASHLLTGDDDLLALHPFRGIAVVAPKTFLTLTELP